MEEQDYRDGYILARITDPDGTVIVGWMEMATPICTPMGRWLGDQQTCEILEVRTGKWAAPEASGAVRKWQKLLGEGA